MYTCKATSREWRAIKRQSSTSDNWSPWRSGCEVAEISHWQILRLHMYNQIFLNAGIWLDTFHMTWTSDKLHHYCRLLMCSQTYSYLKIQQGITKKNKSDISYLKPPGSLTFRSTQKLFWHFHSWSVLRHCICFSVSISTPNCARLPLVATQGNHLNCWSWLK